METVGITLKMPKEFSVKLARYVLDLSEKGIRTNKADLIIKFAESALDKVIKKGSDQ